jgi:hypothetical protein
LRPTPQDGLFDVLFCGFRIGALDLTVPAHADT